MATISTSSVEEVSFEFEVTQIRTEIETHFNELISYLSNRKTELLIELEEIHNKYKHENDKHKEYILEIEKSSKSIRENLQSQIFTETQSGIIKTLEQKHKEIESEWKPKHISFVFDNTLLDRINGFGKISVVNSSYSCLPVVDYKGKVKPVVSVGAVGSGKGQFNCPWGVAVDYRTDNIYVAEQWNNRVQVFSKDGKFLFLFGADKMNNPLYITIDKERVFVSQNGTGCLLIFDLKGNFIKQIDTPGSGEGQFNNSHGIGINVDNGDIYVCDRSNNRIQIFSQDYSYKSQFGIGIVKYPVDIQLTKDTIFVLSDQNSFLYSFNYNLNQVQNTVCDSISKHLNTPCLFLIDGAGNFIISDYYNNNIIIFDNTGELLNKLTQSILHPTGVTLNSKGGIVVVNRGKNSLLMFI
ncbi:RING finger protein nhl-1-like [Oopsacas minuta]|uniref:RING finger protein nhl-1-like n=1 Tax=Oopsacas minuta TaxID=111878 RepID=A0AAV7K3P5_9METZ|nr:RING finger protein nhl-1-like [Oopsacas minuta]